MTCKTKSRYFKEANSTCDILMVAQYVLYKDRYKFLNIQTKNTILMKLKLDGRDYVRWITSYIKHMVSRKKIWLYNVPLYYEYVYSISKLTSSKLKPKVENHVNAYLSQLPIFFNVFCCCFIITTFYLNSWKNCVVLITKRFFVNFNKKTTQVNNKNNYASTLI